MYFYVEEGGTPTPYMGAHWRHPANTISHLNCLQWRQCGLMSNYFDHLFYFRKWLGTRRSCLVVADTADTTVVSAVSATTRHDRFFYLPTKDLALFSIHIPTKTLLTLINDFVVDS